MHLHHCQLPSWWGQSSARILWCLKSSSSRSNGIWSLAWYCPVSLPDHLDWISKKVKSKISEMRAFLASGARRSRSPVMRHSYSWKVILRLPCLVLMWECFHCSRVLATCGGPRSISPASLRVQKDICAAGDGTVAFKCNSRLDTWSHQSSGYTRSS